MLIIGITGGVGAGKTRVLSYIEAHCKCRIVRADEAAHLLYEKGQECYSALVELLGERILNENADIDRRKMAEIIFCDKTLLESVNAVVHPAVKKHIMEQIAYERARGEADYFFIEAALLIEEGYDFIADELWYIHADEDVRKERLCESRGYSEERAARIMQGQLDEAEFRKCCQRVIVNNGDWDETRKQVDQCMAHSLHFQPRDGEASLMEMQTMLRLSR